MKNYSILFFAIASSFNASSQHSITTLDLNGSINVWYDSAVGKENLRLLEGPYYHVQGAKENNHMYFKQMSWIEGSITFEKQNYDEVDLIYNTLDDVLIIRNIGIFNSNEQTMELNKNTVDAFNLGVDRFVHIKESPTLKKGDGYYHELFCGENIDLIAKRIKVAKAGTREIEFLIEDKYYLFHQNEYILFKGIKTLYKTFPENKTLLKQYFRESVNYNNRKKDSEFIKMMSYCDQLISTL